MGGGYHAFQGDKRLQAKVTEDWGGKSESLSSSLWFHVGGSGYPLVEARKERFPVHPVWGNVFLHYNIPPSISRLQEIKVEQIKDVHSRMSLWAPSEALRENTTFIKYLKKESIVPALACRRSSSFRHVGLCTIFRACHTGVFCLVGGPIKRDPSPKEENVLTVPPTNTNITYVNLLRYPPS